MNPDAWTFAAPADAGTLVGASPELLVARRGRTVRSNPLAGTAPRAGDPVEDHANADRLLASPKDREEHAIVVDAVAATLGEVCDDLEWDPEPIAAGDAHRVAPVDAVRGHAAGAGSLGAGARGPPAPHAGDRRLARGARARLDRRRWSPSIAAATRDRWAGSTARATASSRSRCGARCSRSDRATLFAGAGIVAASEPAAELDETERKFVSFLEALRWG